MVLAMLIIGFISFIERVLLACTQYRQGPSSALLHGVAHIILDGIKLYSKSSLDVLIIASGIIFVGGSLGGVVLVAFADPREQSCNGFQVCGSNCADLYAGLYNSTSDGHVHHQRQSLHSHRDG